MAPITATGTGIIPQPLDDECLRGVLESLKSLPNVADENDAAACQQLMEQLVPLIEPLQSWVFEEQVDLHEWIHPLNLVDTAIRWSLATYPCLLLVSPIDRKRSSEESSEEKDAKVAESLQDVQKVPTDITRQVKILVKFLAGLLRNSTGKGIFASVAELVDLLAAADDGLADAALEALQAVAMPPALHKQQSPEVHQHATTLHNSGKIAGAAHARLTALARGWGTRAMGLGLYTVVTADDSMHSQLPPEAGMVHFGFYLQDAIDGPLVDESSSMIQLTISKSEMMKDNKNTNDTATASSDEASNGADEVSDHSSKKRRRVSSLETKTTAELFFLALSKAGGRDKVPSDRLFSLLADIRLARSFHAKSTRVQAVGRRLRALVGILYAHPSHDIMSGYFQAQPELCVEIVDLLRPTVSSANVSASSAAPGTNTALQADAIAGLAGSQTSIPYEVRMLALEALTGLVSRREGSGTARLSSILTELGVGKGQYLGILPTLIRYSLASFGSLSAAGLAAQPSNEASSAATDNDTAAASGTFDIGLAFLEATAAPVQPRVIQVERALAFIDNVLTLTSAVISTSSGTAALTECGLVPALLNTVTVDMNTALERLLPGRAAASCSREEIRRISAMMRFVAAQAVQILEGSIVTYGNALTAFHDLHGVEVLTNRLSLEIKSTGGNAASPSSDAEAMDIDVQKDGDAGNNMDVDTTTTECRTRTSQRVLLFSILTCLTVVFHQESTSSATPTTPSGGSQLRKPELTQVVIAILDNITSYGGHLASLVANLLTDVMNSDPHVVHYVHTSGIATAFLNMIIGEKIPDGGEGMFGYRPIVPPVPELIMALPNVLSAFALTEDGAKAVAKVNPFPALLRIFYHPDYAMPKSRCLLNEMTSIAGTGLDEIIRHVDRLKPLVLKAIAEAISNAVDMAKDLSRREEQALQSLATMSEQRVALENERSCLIQYMLNFGQLMEQILHNEDNVVPFVDAGGLEALLKLFPASMPSGLQFLVHVSSMSSPAVSTLHHSTVEESLSLAFKCIDVKYDPLKLIQTMTREANGHLDRHDECRRKLGADERFVLDRLKDVSLYRDASAETSELAKNAADYLHSVACVEWISSTLATAIRAANRRSEESSSGWGRNEREWKKELASDSFAQLAKRLADFHQESILQVCRIRSQEEFEAKEQQRLLSRSRRLRFRLRIVCPEGAVVRDGTEIDSCASVGSMEMGEIAVATDRCINTSGILRYRTPRGWVSEMTRGHGREPIAEVTSLWEADEAVEEAVVVGTESKRVECDVPDLRSVGVGVLARAQNSYSELFNALSKVVVQSVRTLETRSISFDRNSQGGHVSATLKHVASAIRSGFDRSGISAAANSETSVLNEAGAAMYLGCMIDSLHACLFDERRERRMVNFPLVVNLVSYDPIAMRLSSGEDSDSSNSSSATAHVAISEAIQFVLNHCLSDFSARASTRSHAESGSSSKQPIQRVGLGVGSSFSPVVRFLRRVMMTPLSSSPVASVMSRIKWKDVPALIGDKDIKIMFSGSPSTNEYFEPEHFSRGLLLMVSEVVQKVWVDPRFCFAPPFLTHPFTSLVGEIIAGLEDASKKRPPSSSGSSSRSRPGAGTLLSDFLRGRTAQEDTETTDNEPFEPSEEAVTSLTEMGFSRDQAYDALERTQSNRVEIAMEYALSHAPPSPETAARRRAEREERVRRRQEQQQQQQASSNNNENRGTDSSAQADGETAPVDAGSTNETNTASSMDVVASEPKKKEPLSKEDEYVTRIVSSLASWIDGAPTICCDILANVQPSSSDTLSGDASSMSDGNAPSSNGDGEAEAVTVVLCSFLLDLCNRYPPKRTKIITTVLDALKARISIQQDSCRIDQSSEAAVAALCHATVLFTRALPRTRLLVLQKDLLQPLVSCIQQFVDAEVKGKWSRNTVWPMWLAPVILLLDIMAQPVVAFTEDDETNALLSHSDDTGELHHVYSEHKAQSAAISDLASKIFSSLKAGSPNQAKRSTSDSSSAKNSNEEKAAASDSVKDDSASPSSSEAKKDQSPFSSVPAYFPLLPNAQVQTCVEVCQSLLGCIGNFTGKVAPPPGVAQATLLLLLRLTRTPKVAAQCLRAGVAEAILALPPECKFTGNTGLITLIFRRLLEDGSTLQAAMETEIRSNLTKLHAKAKMSLAKSEKPNLPLRPFVEAVTPLLCRDPSSFLRAMAVTVRIEVTGTKESSDSKVYLLTPDERTRNLSLLADILKSSSECNAAKSECRKESPARRRVTSATQTKTKSGHKTAKRPSTKKNKKEKADIQRGLSQLLQSTGTPSVLVTCLLIDRIMSSSAHAFESEGSWIGENSFLWTGDLLEILADLVLAVPACASAVHNYRPHKSKDKATRTLLTSHMTHALSGCPPPPRTFVSFLLHKLLPQDRWSLRGDPDVWERRKENTPHSASVATKKKRAFRLTKISQTSARVLVALVARPGEGRKRVIADLSFALSGGRLGHGTWMCDGEKKGDRLASDSGEIHALQAWGELCLGLAVPRGTGKNLEGMPSISLENARLMLENGMAHALLYSLHRVRLVHPMASSACGTLLLPFEVLTRPNVSTAVKLLLEKEAAAKNAQDSAKLSDAATRQPEDEHMVDAAFQEPTPISGSGVGDSAESENMGNGDDAETDEGEDDADAMDVEDADDGDGSEDEEGSSLNESEDDESSEEDSDSEMDEDEDSELDESDEVPSDEVEDEGDWNVDYGENQVLDNMENDDFDEGEEDGTDLRDQGIDEGWTRVESSGFGGMLMGGLSGRRNAPVAGRGDGSARARGFIDAAEAMIGSLLRTGEISPDTLAEIEGSLGIRIMNGGRQLRTTAGAQDALGGLGDSLAARIIGGPRGGQLDQSRRGEVVGTLPHIHQRTQPDAGYSNMIGSNGRAVEISSMEYVFGGPSVTAGSRNYDLVTAQTEPPDDDVFPNMSHLDLQLFPGGPASAASARTQHSLHPLLCGVDLPPINALVSDLLPHGLRATRRGQMTTRRPGDWTNSSFSSGGFLVSTSTGNIIRSTRAPGGGMLGAGVPARPVNGPVGWTDDGLPFDATVEDLGSAFEHALAEAVRPETHSSSSERASEGEAEGSGDTNNQETDANGEGTNEDNADMEESGAAGQAESPRPEGEEAAEQNQEADAPQPANNSDDEDGSPGTGSLGDRVASSLASGLRLSPGNDSEDPMASESPDAGDDAAQASTQEEGAVPAAEPNNSDPSNAVDQSMPDAEEAGNEVPAAEQVGEGEGEPAEEGDGDAPPTENANALACPPDVDPEVFASLPQEMQQDLVDQHTASRELAAQIDGSSLDPDVLAALPEEMRREVIEQERRERQMREQQEAPADPALAEEMDNASFIASLAPDLREEILLTADETFLSSLPPSIVAEAQILRERAMSQRRGFDHGSGGVPHGGGGIPDGGAPGSGAYRGAMESAEGATTSAKRRQRSGKLRVELDHEHILHLPEHLSPPVAKIDLQLLIRLLYLLSPVRPTRVQQKVFQNMCVNPGLRAVLSSVFVKLLQEDAGGVRTAVEAYGNVYAEEPESWRKSMDKLFGDGFIFPPTTLLGAAPEFPDSDAFGINMPTSLLRRKQAASVAANLPKSADGSGSDSTLPPVVAARLVDTILQLCKSSARFCLHTLVSPVLEEESVETKSTGFESLLDLLKKPMFSKSSANLDHLLTVLEAAVSPLSHLSKQGDEDMEISQRDLDTAAASGKEWVDVPRVTVSQQRLQLLCSILRMETCRDSAFTKVNTIVRRLCRVDTNRGYVLEELASVADALGADAIRDLRALRIRMDEAVAQHKTLIEKNDTSTDAEKDPNGNEKQALTSVGTISSSVTLSTSTSELKLLRVLQTLHALCGDTSEDSPTKKGDGSIIVTEELVHLLRQMKFSDLWDELSLCLKTVQVLEGVSGSDDDEEKGSDEADANDDASGDDNGQPKKKLRNSAAGLLARFLPSVEAFFVSNASATRPKAKQGEDGKNEVEELALDNLVDGKRLMDFVSTNKVLLNALVRNNPGLLDKGLRALVQVPRCRVFLDFDVKRQWFKTQVRRLRQHASRRHGSLRLHIRRKYVFEDAYHQLRLRNADEMRGRLHITFRNEEGVDAGGLSREFFGILGKEIFNPNYALFTSTEDGCTFQPNPNSNINPDHLSYFRFVGRIVGKAVADGYLLDAHFTRSLYKHMLGMQPTHHDMEAIDPDYYRNLQTILNYNLEDIGLELTFSIEDHSFGRSHVMDLIPSGRSVAVTEENKEEYVRLVCQNRMTTAIQNQIKAYLDGFYEMVNPELIAIFTPRELELLISGLPDIDVSDLKKNTDYVGWRQTDKEIGWFWNILFSLSRNEKAAFLQFVTGSSKVPLTGFGDLQGMRGVQKFSIHKVAAGSRGALMSAHTCFNSLDLPVYQSEEEMRQKLIYAINEGGGAFLFA